MFKLTKGGDESPGDTDDPGSELVHQDGHEGAHKLNGSWQQQEWVTWRTL